MLRALSNINYEKHHEHIFSLFGYDTRFFFRVRYFLQEEDNFNSIIKKKYMNIIHINFKLSTHILKVLKAIINYEPLRDKVTYFTRSIVKFTCSLNVHSLFMIYRRLWARFSRSRRIIRLLGRMAPGPFSTATVSAPIDHRVVAPRR